ncbi:unnamed protein product [Rhizoctonia solani]|uniref:Fungal lipase-type domain-containing protein n=1 Tax=Rhizoctonia solani TaxID=456999 RepID=A0A8H2ZUS7_9AGAM|nr:unnamed protein product [Rhizoctonia solani]
MVAVSQPTASDASEYDVFQQVFGVSMTSNVAQKCKGKAEDLQRKLADSLPDALTSVGTGWEVVWGPVVWKADPDRADTHYGNAWYVAKHDSVVFEDGTSHPTYVVAIAGTSGMYDVIYEDAAIDSVVDPDVWAGNGSIGLKIEPTYVKNDPSLPKDKAFISLGFSRGLFQPVNKAPPQGNPGYPHTLPEFLQTIQPIPSEPAPRLVFTGHSLGGALAPTLAYVLCKAGVFSLFSKDLSNVYVYPTAAPTPGNLVFAENFKKFFPPRPSTPAVFYKCWNVTIINHFDIVPCAYAVDPKYAPEILSSVPGMYGNKWLTIVEAAVAWLKYMAHTLYVPIALSPFDSPIPKPSTKPNNVWAYLDAAHIQHMDAYLKAILNIAHHKQLCDSSKLDDLKLHPVLGHIVYRQLQVEEHGGVLADGMFEVPNWPGDEKIF